MRPNGRVMLLGLLLALTGCGGKRLYPVEGVVQYEDGTPARELAGGTVSLESVADKSNAAGEIGKDGTFRIRDPFGKDGASAGEYRVLVLPSEGNERRNPPLIDRTYSRYETSGITIAVKEESNRVTVVVRRPANAKKG
jgi:hypothetical protein